MSATSALTQAQYASLAEIPALTVTVRDEVRAASQRDFGGLRTGTSIAVARPDTAEALARLVDVARRTGLRLTPRSLGYSQSGQSLPRAGVSVDMSGFQDIHVDADARSARCGAGATWRQLLAAAMTHGLVPTVMPFNLDLSIGGTLSAGGIGSTSHVFGFAVSSVQSVEVVTGVGEIVTASPTQRSEIYDAVLGGVGRFGFICDATLRLRPAHPLTRTHYLLYDDLEAMLADEARLMVQPWCTHLEGFGSAAIQGIRRGLDGRRAPFARWFYGLHVSTEFPSGREPEAATILEGLRFREHLHVEDNSTADYAARYDIRFAMMRATGAWELLHPWLECMLPADVAPRLLPELIPQLPLLFGDGHRMMPVADVPKPGLFMVPSPGPAYGLAVLPPGIAPAFEAAALAGLRSVHDRLVEAGGKRYLSGWLFEPDEAAWQLHYGAHYETWRAAKRALDPDGVLDSCLDGPR